MADSDSEREKARAALRAGSDKVAAAERKFLEAKEKYRAGGDKRAYERARDALTKARVEQRQAEEEDPDHPRGSGRIANVSGGEQGSES